MRGRLSSCQAGRLDTHPGQTLRKADPSPLPPLTDPDIAPSCPGNIEARPVCPKTAAWDPFFASPSGNPRSGLTGAQGHRARAGRAPSLLWRPHARSGSYWRLDSVITSPLRAPQCPPSPTPPSIPIHRFFRELRSSGIGLGEGHIWAGRGRKSIKLWSHLKSWSVVYRGPGKQPPLSAPGPAACPRGHCYFCQRGEVIIARLLPAGPALQSSRESWRRNEGHNRPSPAGGRWRLRPEPSGRRPGQAWPVHLCALQFCLRLISQGPGRGAASREGSGPHWTVPHREILKSLFLSLREPGGSQGHVPVNEDCSRSLEP
ncbi:hypothetical protein H8959_018875 [Pygathrix nigripes]